MDYPKLRLIEAFPVENGLLCIRDPEGFSDKILVLEPEAVFVVSLFDGNHSILDIQEEFTHKYGVLLFSDKIKEIADQLDICLFLENQRFYEAKEKVISNFKSRTVRLASHAGTAYEANPEKLKEQLASLFIHKDGPGLPDTSSPSGRLSGLIAPHIDLNRGGLCFARSYAELARESKAETFIILGIAHSPAAKIYVLTDKDFDTPLGTVPLNREITDKLRKTCKTNFYIDEFLHKNEHSVEFQVLFLKYLYPEKDITMVPVLCSFMQESISRETSPYDDEQVREFIDALKDIMSEYGEKLCIIAGVDMSHIGRRFGQNITINPEVTAGLESSDKAYLDIILSGDAEEFMKAVYKEKDRTNICGIPAIYTLLKLIEQKESKKLMYDQAVDNNNHSIVSFAGAAFYRE
ncbi:MAG: AmmeMemoRadiSam system protein B [Spirochaetales bacterium]|nr:AmmeMemoRadiSam system protein B [Spirochaetales bacterium]